MTHSSFLITVLCANQWPDDFNWETTRAINRPSPGAGKINEKAVDNDSDDKKHTSSVKESVSGDSFSGSEEEDELDPVALKKAFKFATYSSLALVRCSFQVLIILC